MIYLLAKSGVDVFLYIHLWDYWPKKIRLYILHLLCIEHLKENNDFAMWSLESKKKGIRKESHEGERTALQSLGHGTFGQQSLHTSIVKWLIWE